MATLKAKSAPMGCGITGFQMRRRTLILARRSASLELEDSYRQGIGTYHKTPVAIRHSRSLRRPLCQLIGLAHRANTSDKASRGSPASGRSRFDHHQRKQQEKAR